MSAKTGIHDFLSKSTTPNATPPPSPRHGRESGHPRLWQPKAHQMKISIFIATLVSALCALPFTAPPAKAATTIPFIGCEDDGLAGTAPTGQPISTDLPDKIASKLAVYAGAYLAVLAPRGWSCQTSHGTTGVSLWVYPAGASPKTIGPIVSESGWMGDNEQGNSIITSFGGRYFPKIVTDQDVKDFMSGTSMSGNENQFLNRRYPSDKVNYLTPKVIEFITPADKFGLATQTLGAISSVDEYGLAGILDDPNSDRGVFFFVIRPSPALSYLTHYILKFERGCFLTPFCSISTIVAPD